MEGTTMTTNPRCTYCGGAGGNDENPDHNVRCPRFHVADINVEGLDALRRGERRPVPMAPCTICGHDMPVRPVLICASCEWLAERGGTRWPTSTRNRPG